MRVEDVFEGLSYGELSNLALSGEGSGDIDTNRISKLVLYLNDGLARIHNRFKLREREISVRLVEDQKTYHLKSQFAESSGSTSVHYLMDLEDEEPFDDTILKILGVYDADTGKNLPVNDREHRDSVFTPKEKMLRVPEPEEGKILNVVYQATHSKLFGLNETETNLDDVLAQEVELPSYLEEAINNYVAHKLYSHMNGGDNAARARDYYGAYDLICSELEQKDTPNEGYHVSHMKLEERGFV